MKAVVLEELGGPDHLEIKEVDTPEPGPGEVRVRLKNSALNRRYYWNHYGNWNAARAATRWSACVSVSDRGLAW